MNAGTIDAVLTLNATNFNEGLKSSLEAVNKFVNGLNILQTTNVTESLSNLKIALEGLKPALSPLKSITSDTMKSFTNFSLSISRVGNALKSLSNFTNLTDTQLKKLDSIFDKLTQSIIRTYSEIQKLSTGESELGNSFTNLITKASDLISKLESVDNHLTPIVSNLKQTSTNTREFGDRAKESSSELDSFKRELGEVNTKLSSVDSSTKSTAKSLGYMGTALRNAFSNAFNRVVTDIENAVVETYKAKSEMQSWFEVMGLSSSEVDSFNKKLDETVSQFQRVNKYGMGETIASLGVEFDLTEAQMEKAMDVTAMITNEYLRAGRSTSEANLAIKDILQGQFQRLSRETGVKSEQLKETGLWDDDDPSKNSINDLLNALEKVGKDRNWDTIAQKASSINDIMLIGRNRISEVASEIIDRFTPALTNTFNALMDVGNIVGGTLNGAFEWFLGNSWSATATKIGLVAFALKNVLLWLVNVRTGANLLQMAQMGLTKSIGATVLGLNAEKVATLGVRGALAQKLTGLTAEKIAEVGSTQAIYGHILGLNAEEVAENGLVGAINKSIISRAKETVETEVQTGANIGFLGSLMAVVTGEEIATGTTLTLSEALGVLTAEMLMNPITWFIGALGLLAGAIYVVTGGLDEHWDKMKNFNEALDNSDDLVQSNADYLERLGNNLGEDSEWYKMASESVDEFNQKLGSSKALVKAYNDEMNSLGVTISTISKMNSQGLGLSKDQLKELSEYATGLDEGYNTYYRALQVLHKQQDDYGKSDRTLIKNMQDRGAEEEDILNKREQHMKHWNDYMKHSAEHNTSDDWWSGSWAGLLAGLDSIQIGLDYKTEDLANWFHDFNEQWSQFGKDIEASVGGFGDWITGGWNKLQSDFTNWINDVGTSLSDSWKSLEEMWNNNIVQPLQELWGGFWSFDWLFGESVSASDGSTDHPSFMEDVSNILGFDVQQWITDFQSDPLGTLGIELPSLDIGGFIASLFGSDNGEDGKDIDPVMTFINNNIINPLQQGLTNFINDPIGTLQLGTVNLVDFITNLIPSNVEGIYQWAMDNIITPLVDGVKQGILNTPILGDVASLLGVGGDTETSSQESGQTVGTNFTTGIQTGLAPLDGIINTAFQGLNLDDITANFTTNTQTMTTNASTTAQNVSGSYTTMKDNQRSALDSMVSHNTTQFEAMKVKSNTSLSQMRDSTSNVTSQMTTAWSMMKDSIIASAEKIKTDSSNRFSTLSDRIGGFYRKIQNPSLWGSAGGGRSSHARRPSVGRTVAHALKPNGYGGGLATRSTNATMTVSRLKNELCPDGNCGNIFDGYDSNDIVNVWDFLQTIGEGHGLGGWNFASNHNQYIKTKSDEWKTAPPIIQLLSGIATNTSFKVGEFNEATPKISFSTFQDIATAIFSQIPYRLYFDSSWKGSWLGALQAGACNCYDGALALMALAETFGFRASMGHGTWTNPDGKQTAHVWAIINGIKMDTTGMQQRGSWNPSASAGGSPISSGSDKTVNITIDMQGATIYGVEDLDNRIEQGVRRGLREEFNDSYSVII